MNKRFTILLMAVMAVGCIQDPEEPFNLPDTPTLSVDETSVTRVSMVVNGSFGSNMTDITAYGVEISETLFESGGTYKTLVPQEMGADGFSLGVSDLKSNGTYFLRAFISNGHSRMYSSTLTQKTPETSVASISDVTLKDDYYLVATIEDNGGRSIEDVGFMWSTSAERKDIKREKRYPATLSGDGKTFTLPVNEVGEGTHYIMAYAEDDKDGTGYSRIPYEWVVTSDQGVAIEDPNFKKYLLMYHDGNEDGKMSYAEMEAIESIDVHTDNIKTVREINMMPRLRSLYVSGTQSQSGQLTSLDMSKNTGLSALDCSNNKLRQLDASSISGLVYLNCDGNPMDTLFLSYYQKFEELRYPKETTVVYVDAPPVDPNVQPDNEIWYTTADGSVVTPNDVAFFGQGISLVSNTYADGKGVMKFSGDVTVIGDKSFGVNTELQPGLFKTIRLPETCTSLGEFAFQHQSHLEEITFPSSLANIARYAFYNCEAIKGIDLPDALTSIDSLAFFNAAQIKKVVIPESVRNLSPGAFSRCSSIERFEGKYADASGKALVDGNTLLAVAPSGLTSYTVSSGITAIADYVFCGYTNLKGIDLPSGLLYIGKQSFLDCTGLTDFSLPSGLLSIGPQSFVNCRELTQMMIPESVNSIGKDAFRGCFGIVRVSIPSQLTQLPKGIFFRCQSIAEVFIPQSIQSIGQDAFYGCSGLGSITMESATPPSGGDQMFDGSTCPIYVPRASVDTYKAANYWSTYADRIQANPNDFSASKYLTFTSEGTTKISLSNAGDNAPVLYYSTDTSNWTQWDYGELTFTQGNPIYICGDNPEGFSHSMSSFSRFSISGDSCSVSGDIMSLLNMNEDVTVIPSEMCFFYLFEKCTNLTSAPSLPATTLTPNCYMGLFSGCSGLTAMPSLPATSMAASCYSDMFSGCTNLTTAVAVLPATTLAKNCYSQMFSDCAALTHAPALPATTLAQGCYFGMFYGCSSMTDAPVLPATSLADDCYQNMFAACTGLTSAPELTAATLTSFCYSTMFSGCTNLNYVKCLATDITADRCVEGWLNNVSSTGTFVKAAEMNDWPTGSSGIPSGWTVVNDGETPNGGHEGTGEEEWN